MNITPQQQNLQIRKKTSLTFQNPEQQSNKVTPHKKCNQQVHYTE